MLFSLRRRKPPRSSQATAVLTLVVGWAWQQAEAHNARNNASPTSLAREMTVTDATGRVLVQGPKDFPAASKLMRQFKLGSAAAASARRDYPVAADLTSLSSFRFINAFLRTNPRLPGEEALMAQFEKHIDS